ncbi:ribosomal protein L11 methyltransferase [Niastella yeongjuensis]|uniref:Ribosomal protein L11 methyltransferase n=1 Tax=Niastella yeongjuensis TaxID=354355 RepID=A0A1V9EEU6_9BACT|nr:50S ribosomal protein L11 methyltransferase [Niastella yeongjuensis]OQP44659.1 ribosomal protein L11 methyltransferase [Niastella yeongjuensis]SEO79565.1 ribosomal protein L11 methyltransferase [Niastella yeongjuensis]
MQNYIHIKFQPVSKEQQEILVAQLNELGFEGFEEGFNYISAYIPEDQYHETDTYNLTAGTDTVITKEVIAPRNWNAEWEQNFQPVIIDGFCGIRAHFHEPLKNVQHEIIITPKMSFGTGHHATTHLMIQNMQQLSFAGKKVLDFGTGTGVLAILAEKLGAASVTAIDNDEWSINNAQENIALNHCSNIALSQADYLQMSTEFDIILANINKHVLIANMAGIKQHLTLGGVVIMSGLLGGDRPDIEKSATNNGLSVVDCKMRGDWMCLLFKK